VEAGVRRAALVLAIAALAACLLAPVAYFLGSLGEDAMKAVFLAASIAWFVSAGVWTTMRGKNREDE
jgi:hypothetical protein